MPRNSMKILKMLTLETFAGQETAWQQAEAAMQSAMLCIGAKNGAAVLRRYRYY